MLREVLYNIDPNTMILGLLFIIFFVLIQFLLGRSLRDKMSSNIIAFCVALLAVYGLNRTNFDISGVFYNWGIGDGIIYGVIPFIILVGLIWITWKLGISRALMIVGGLLIIASFFVYEKAVVLILGIALVILGFILWIRRKKKGITGQGGNVNPPDRRNELIRAAKKFRRWAKKQPNPKFVGGYTYFINYLKNNRNWGNSEAAICQTLGVSQNDITNIFNRYGIV
jgi:hypothetical protein